MSLLCKLSGRSLATLVAQITSWLGVWVRVKGVGCSVQGRCRANTAHMRQSRPDSGHDFQSKVLETFQVVPSSLGSGIALSRDIFPVSYVPRTVVVRNTYFLNKTPCPWVDRWTLASKTSLCSGTIQTMQLSHYVSTQRTSKEFLEQPGCE